MNAPAIAVAVSRVEEKVANIVLVPFSFGPPNGPRKHQCRDRANFRLSNEISIAINLVGEIDQHAAPPVGEYSQY